MIEQITQVTSVVLPLVGAALVLALVVTGLIGRLRPAPRARQLTFLMTFIVALLPVLGDGMSLAHFIRVITGDLSLTTLFWFTVLAARYFMKEAPATDDTSMLRDYTFLGPACLILLTATILYPTALGLTTFDLYALGYYPVVLGPLLFAIFSYCVWTGLKIPAVMAVLAFIGFAFGLLESDNLWDYLLDPVLTVYAIAVVVKQRRQLRFRLPTRTEVETGAVCLIATFLAFSIFLARFNHDAFQYQLVIEDGFTEWCTVIALLAAMVTCIRRLSVLQEKRSLLFLGVTGVLTLFCLFGAGEEISWGQRILGLETPEYFKERNAQGEIGLHNMIVEINGEDVKLNKLIFGTGLALCLLIYLFIATPLYRRNASVKSFFDQIAAPMPRNFHIIGYLAVVAVVELLVDSSKRGELTEFGGSIIFALNVIYPYNPELFDPGHDVADYPAKK